MSGAQPQRAPLLLDLRTRLRLSLAATMAAIPALRRLQDLWNQASAGLPPAASPLFLLGTRYDVAPPPRADGDADAPADAEADAAAAAAAQQQAQTLLLDWASRPWMSYRRDFPPLGPGLCTDAGWGCTLRSGQMLLAHALTLRALGRDWRWRGAAAAVAAEAGGAAAEECEAASQSQAAPPEEAAHAALLRLFADAPGAPFGVHALCAAGAPAGVTAGAWLGPHTLCAALAAAARAALPPGALLLRVVAAGGGGAPTLFADDVADACFAEAASSAATSGPPFALPLPPAPQAGFTPVLLLFPLVLGLGRTVNPAYVPSLRAALQLRWSCGVVGGRPGASLFLTGAAGDAALFLDPHAAVQPAAVVQVGPPKSGGAPTMAAIDPAQAAAAAAAVASYHCAALRHAPLANMDPSMALAFYAGTAEELRQLAAALAELAAAAPAAPLLTVAAREPLPRQSREADEADNEAAAAACEVSDGGSDEGEECWTVV